MTRTLVVGIGNDDRGDDGAGLEVARRLRARAEPQVTVREVRGDALALLDAWAGAPRVIVVDAASGSGAPGTVHRFDTRQAPLPAGLLHGSTHAWGVPEALQIARALGRAPAELFVYAIEGGSFAIGRRLSRPVRRAVRRVERSILRETRCAAPAGTALLTTGGHHGQPEDGVSRRTGAGPRARAHPSR